MKTKIIYISGSEVFEMADVRAALDEVRRTLGLSSDTILFGVPVDQDDAISNPAADISVTAIETVIEAEQTPDSEIINTESDDTIPEIAEPAQITTSPADSISEIDVAPIKKSRGRPRKALQDTTPEEEIPDSAPQSLSTEQIAPASEKVIPILSVLAASAEQSTPADEFITNNDAASPMAESDIAIVEQAYESEPDILAEQKTIPATEDITAVAKHVDTPDDINMTASVIEDMIADDVPDTVIEQTLEQLLESMTPLREDHNEFEHTPAAAIEIDDAATIDALDDPDATLEQLATEFADNEDSIQPVNIAPAHGKIGKLKNILPFKKARREDTGIMGDLFGWAGVAANDDDFAMPGFFSTAAKK